MQVAAASATSATSATTAPPVFRRDVAAVSSALPKAKGRKLKAECRNAVSQ